VFSEACSRGEFEYHTTTDLLQSCTTAKEGILDQGNDGRGKQISVKLLPPH